MAERKSAQAEQVEVQPAAAAAAAPPAAPPPAVDPSGPARDLPDQASPEARVKRATWRGNPGEYITPLLLAERDPATGEVTERIFHTPARDLSEADWQEMPAEHRTYVRSHHAYDVDTDAHVAEAVRAERAKDQQP